MTVGVTLADGLSPDRTTFGQNQFEEPLHEIHRFVFTSLRARARA
jgi:hypothetical protein